MKPYSEFELEFLKYPERFTFNYFKTKKLENNPLPIALSIADEELLNHYDNEYEYRTFQSTRFFPQMDTTGSAYNELENYIAETSTIILSEQFPKDGESINLYNEFSEFRRKILDTLHSYPDIQKVQILKKIGIASGFSPSEIDQISRLFSTGSSLFAMELYLSLNRTEKWKSFQGSWPKSEKALIKIAETPSILLSLWDHQEQARKRWINNGGNGIIQMATATGKTLVGLASAYYMFSIRGNLNVLVICHSRAILNQWRREVIEKLGFIGEPNDDYKKSLSYKGKFVFKFETVQKVIRDPSQYITDLLIMDEVHHGAGVKFREALNIPCRWKMGLSATVEGKEKNEVLEDYLGGSVYTFTLKEAQNKGIIPDFKLLIHKTFLDVSEEEEFISITEKITNLLRYINVKQTSTISRLSRNRFERFENVGDFVRLMKTLRYRGDDIPEEWSHLIGLINKRRWIIHRSSPKRVQAIKVTEKLAVSHKCVLFAMDIASCNEMHKILSKTVPSFLIHSEMKPNDVSYTLNEFRRCTNGVLIAPKMLDEGIDIPDVDIGINVAASKTELQLIQRLGRILRNRPGKEPVFHHFVVVPNKYIVSEDSFTFQNDLSWITDIALKMGISIEEISDESEEFSIFEREAEDAVRHYLTTHESLNTEDFGSIKIQNIVDAILPSAQSKLVNLLNSKNDSVTDEDWAEMLRSAYSNEQMLDIPSHRWILIIGERDPVRIKDLFIKYGTIINNLETSNISNDKIHLSESKNTHISVDTKPIPNVSRFITLLMKDRSQADNDRAANALLKSGSASVDPLIGILNYQNKEVVQRVISILEQIGDKKAVVPLIRCLDNSSPDVRRKAALALGELGDPRGRIALMKLQRDSNLKVKKAAVKALEKLR